MKNLEGFCSKFGAAFYGLSENNTKIDLIKKDQEIPQSYDFGKDQVKPLRAGEIIKWTINNSA